MLKVGMVAIDGDQKWVGGRYYLHHLIRCVAEMPLKDRVQFHGVSWASPPENDPFEEVRQLMGEPIVVRPPSRLFSRLKRKFRRMRDRTPGARDLFDAHGLDVFFPIPPSDCSGVRYVFWLADFQYMRRPDLLSKDRCTELHQYFSDHVKAASRIVLSSEDARNDFAKVFPESLDRTHVVRFCSVPDVEWWKLEPRSVASRHGLPERFLIVCNQFTRHKNHLTLLEAIKRLGQRGREDVHLVCTGSTFDHRQEGYIDQVRAFIAQHGLESRVHILGLISRSEQIALLRRSVAVLQPSWFEGWSTIVEDAKTLGKTMLVTDLPVHHEQLGPLQPHYLSLEDADEWVFAIESVWGECEAGPNADAEAAGRRRLETAKIECARHFTGALRAAHGRVS